MAHALDVAVFAAYGWPAALSDEDILAGVVALNAQRSAEERSGLVRWLRPEFQAPNELLVQTTLAGMAPVESPAPVRREQPWPPSLPDQVRAVKERAAGRADAECAADCSWVQAGQPHTHRRNTGDIDGPWTDPPASDRYSL